MLPKGAACFECRRLKVKCDGLVPLCSRCKFLCKKCDYTPANARPLSTTRALEARALELEMTIHKLTLPSTHDLSLVSTRLLERIARLGNLPPPKRLTGAADSTLILKAPHYEGSEAERRYGKVLVEGITKRELSAVQRAVEYELRSYNWRELEEMDELPLTLSIHLINLFLPSRSLYYFLVDISHFIYRVSLPSSHPEAIHPCLLNACYLAACSRDDGGGLTAFKDYFLERTRRFLQQSLMFADRIPDFLWASVVLSVFFVKERRLVESVSTASATARFALACGLSLPGDSAIAADGEASTIDGLLPPPRDAVEADDRVRLAHAIYLGVQAFPQLCGYPPTFPYEDWWSPISREALLKFQDGKLSMTASDSWRLELYLRVLVTNTFERVKKYARSVAAGGHSGREEEYSSIETQIRVQHDSLLPLYDPRQLQSLEESSPFNLQVVLGYLILYGSGLVLHSLWAAHHPRSRTKMLECLQALIDICALSRKHKRPHLGLSNMVHMMNAVRLMARELQRPEVRENAKLSVSYCLSIEMLLDFLDDTMIFFPAWVDILFPLKDSLTTAAISLSS